MKIQIKRTIAILLFVCFVLSITAATVSAETQVTKIPGKILAKTVKAPISVGNVTVKLLVASGIIATPSNGLAPLKVAFSARAFSDVGIPASGYSWDFGDGDTAIGPTPIHTYNYPGIYTVKLNLKDAKGSTSQLQTTVTVEGLMLDFTTTNSPSGPAPYTVNFKPTISSSTMITSYDWNFGDGTTHDFNAVPVPHKYTNAGSYTVSLTITDSNGVTSSEVKPNFVTIT